MLLEGGGEPKLRTWSCRQEAGKGKERGGSPELPTQADTSVLASKSHETADLQSGGVVSLARIKPLPVVVPSQQPREYLLPEEIRPPSLCLRACSPWGPPHGQAGA